MIFEGYVLVENKLNKRHYDNRYQLAHQFVPSTDCHHQVQHQLTDAESYQTNGVERHKTQRGLVLYLEIDLTIQDKRREDTYVNTDDVRPKIRHYVIVAQHGIYAEIQACAESADQSVQNQIPKAVV